MNYLHRISSNADNNSKKNNSKIIFQENDINNINIIKDKNSNNLSKNLINSEIKNPKGNIEIIQNNKLIKQKELNKKVTQKKLAENNKIISTENKDKKYNQNIINSKISNKNLLKKI